LQLYSTYKKKRKKNPEKHKQDQNRTVYVVAAPFLFRLPEFPVIKSTPLREDEE